MPAIVKVIAFFAAWVSLWLPVAIPTAIVLKWRPPQPLGNKKLPFLASLYLIVPIILWGAITIEGTSFSDLGFAWEPKILVSLGIGLSIGTLSLAILFCLHWALGWMEWRKPGIDSQPPLLSSILLNLVLALWVSGTEELIFRGFLQSELQQDYSAVIAATIASLIFAAAHLIWEWKDTLPQLPGLWLMGMVLALARACDGGTLGLAIGLHTGWIWVIATLDTAQLITYKGSVPEWVTGIGAKPLASASGLLLLLATAGLISFPSASELYILW